MNLIQSKQFWKHPIVSLGGASFLAQGLNALLMPILARLYSPSEFGQFSIYLSFLSLAAVLSSLRYELAIPIPPDRGEGLSLLRLAFWFNLLWAAFLYAVGKAFPAVLIAPLDGLRSQWMLVCLGVASLGVYQALSFWALRERSYLALARFRLEQGITQPVAKMGLGWTGVGMGLLLGDILGRALANLSLVYKFRKELFKASWANTGSGSWALMVRFRAFPLIAGWAGLLNAAGLYLPVLLFAKLYSATQTGLFGLAQTLIAIPMILVGQALSQLFIGELSILLRERPADAIAYLKKEVWRLGVIGLPLTLMVGILGPWVFGWVFGTEWTRAGEYVRILFPMFAMQFVSVPVSNTLNLLEAQGTQLAWDAARVGVLVMWFALASHFTWDDETALMVFSSIMALLYCLHLFIVFYFVRIRCANEV